MEDLEEHFSYQSETDESNKLSITKDGTSSSTPEVRSNVFNEHFISIADNIIDNTINTEPDLTSLVDFVNRKKAGNSADFSIPLISERDFFF